MERHSCHPDTFRGLFYRHAAKLRRFVFYKSGDWVGAEDLVQEAFLRLWKNCRQVPPEKARSFLYTVAGNLFLDDTRRWQVAFKFQQQPENARHDLAPPADFALETAEFQQQLEAALGALPEPQRLVFLMNRLEKLTYAEIAEQLGLSVKAVEKRMHLALVELRKLVPDI